MITGKEALIALANGDEVEYFDDKLKEWVYMDIAHHFKRNFRLKPRTITINGVEVPAPFDPKVGDEYYYINSGRFLGYAMKLNDGKTMDAQAMQFGAWRTEGEIKQVVSALRSVLK